MNYKKNIDENFINAFNNSWGDALKSIDSPFSSSLQLLNGNRLRPILFCWGYAFSSKNSELDFTLISKAAVTVEMIHKASILIDDLVDNDNLRNGEQSFHSENSNEVAIVFASLLLGKSSISFLDVCDSLKLSDRAIIKNLKIISETIIQMTTGCLKEMELSNYKKQIETKKIHEILNLETASLIRNSLLMGFHCNNRSNEIFHNQFFEIGNNYGNVFQFLNDLEPFSENKKIVQHKGNINIDINRKNLAISVLISLSNKKDLKVINTLDSNEKSYFIFLELLKKYKVKEIIINDCDFIIEKTKLEFVNLKNENPKWCNDFLSYLDYLYEFCKKRL